MGRRRETAAAGRAGSPSRTSRSPPGGWPPGCRWPPAAAAAPGGTGGRGDRLTLVAYSTPREAHEQLIPAFQRTEAGKGTSFSQSYGASGDQSRAVQDGLAADVVTLALEPDMTKLVDAGLVAEEVIEPNLGGKGDGMLAYEDEAINAQQKEQPVDAAAAAGADCPRPKGLFTIKDLGGWSEVNKRFFDKEAGIVADIERQVGVSVGS